MVNDSDTPSYPAAAVGGEPAAAYVDPPSQSRCQRGKQAEWGMSCVNTSHNERVPMLLDLVAKISRATRPQEVLESFARGMQALGGDDGYIAVSTRDVPDGMYRVTRMMLSPEDLDQFGIDDPWKNPDLALPVSGGFLSDLIATPYPEIIHNLHVPNDPVLGDALEVFGSLMAIPLFDDGRALNWAIPLSRESSKFSVEDLEQRILQANLIGGTVRTVLISNRLHEAHQKIQEEVDRIASIQRALLPESMPQIPGLKIAASYETFDRAGGDYYDFIPFDCTAARQEQGVDRESDGDCDRPPSRWGFLIADASGHGPAAAVIMAMLQAILHAMPRIPEGPAEVLEHVNRHLCLKRIEGSFVTAFLGIYEPETRELTFARAGHPPPLIKNSGSGSKTRRLDEAGALPLGVLADADFEEATVTLEPGQSLVLYTDGITEAFDPSGEMFGIEGIEAALHLCTGEPDCVVESIKSALLEHEASVRPTDDQTFVVVKVDEDHF